MNDDDSSSHLSGAVRSALGLLADGIDRARQMASPAGERARQMGDKVREESSEVLGRVRDEGTQVVGKLRGHVPGGGAGTPQVPDTDEMRRKAAEALDIAKTVAAALLVGGVKAVQFVMREWQSHTGSASSPEGQSTRGGAAPAPTPTPPPGDAGESAPPVAHGTVTNEPQPEPEINNWDAVEAEEADAADDAWALETDGLGTAGGDPVAGVSLAPDVEDEVVYTTESETADPVSPSIDETDGPALRAEAAPIHSGHEADAPPVEGFEDMTIGSLRGRLGSFDLAQLEGLRDYERTHGARPQVLTMIENRIAKIASHPHDD
jgi:hypothetical protein